MTVAAWASARSISAAWRLRRPASTASMASRSHRRMSVATWSLRDRAVWSRPAASPISASRRASTFMWTSSSAGSKRNSPASTSAATRSSPSRIAAQSSAERTPRAASMAACAPEARMSWSARRRSNATDAPMRSMISDGPSANRPPHIGLAVARPLSSDGTMPRALEQTAGGWKPRRAPERVSRTGAATIRRRRPRAGRRRSDPRRQWPDPSSAVSFSSPAMRGLRRAASCRA